jgi:hypothetical protein
MNKETIVTSAFRVHRSKFSCSLAAALLDGLFEHPARCSSFALDVQAIEALLCRNSFSQLVRQRTAEVEVKAKFSATSQPEPQP